MHKHPFRIFIEVCFFFLLYAILEIPILGMLVRANPSLGLPWDAIIHAIFFFLITIIINKVFPNSFKAYNILLVILSILMFAHAIYYLFYYQGRITMLAIPNYFCMILGYCGAWVWTKKKKKLGLFIGSLGLCLGVLYLVQFKYFGQYYSYRTLTGKVNQTINLEPIHLTNQYNDTLVFNPDMYYVLDFWHTRCSSCFASMPKFNTFHELNKNDKVQYLLVNKPLEHFDSVGQAHAVIQSKGMSIPNYIGTPNIDSLIDVFEYPTIMVIKNSKILFKGRADIYSEKRLAQIMK